MLFSEEIEESKIPTETVIDLRIFLFNLRRRPRKAIVELAKQTREIRNISIVSGLGFIEPNFEPSTIWSFHYCSLLLQKLLNERQCEEWIGDLEEALYKIHDHQQPKWKFHIQMLRRTFDIFKGVFISKLYSLIHKIKLRNR